MKKVKFMTKLATVWLVGLFMEGMITLGSVFAHPISEWSIWAIAAQVAYMVALIGIAIWWQEESELEEGLNTKNRL
jgi:hypothetical protein